MRPKDKEGIVVPGSFKDLAEDILKDEKEKRELLQEMLKLRHPDFQRLLEGTWDFRPPVDPTRMPPWTDFIPPRRPRRRWPSEPPLSFLEWPELKFPTRMPDRFATVRGFMDERKEHAAWLNIEIPLMPIVKQVWEALSDAPCPIERAFWEYKEENLWGSWVQNERTIRVAPHTTEDGQISQTKSDPGEVNPWRTIVHEIVHALYPYRNHDHLFIAGLAWANEKLWKAMM